jgi:iron complex transport system substrate-binding protein
MDDEIDSILGGIVRLDSLLTGGSDASGRALVATMRAQLDSLESLEGKAPRTLLVLGREPDSLQGLFTAGPGTFLQELLRIAGAEPWIAEGRPGYRMVALEALVADPPQLAIEVGAGVPGDGAEKIWRDLGLSDVRVERLDFDGAMIPGPRLVETARRLRQRIHPEPPRDDS